MFLNLQISTLSQTSNPLIFRPFSQSSLTRNLKEGLQLSYGTPSLTKTRNRRYKYLVLGSEGPYLVKGHSNSKSKYTEEDIIKMLEILADNIFVVFQRIIGNFMAIIVYE